MDSDLSTSLSNITIDPTSDIIEKKKTSEGKEDRADATNAKSIPAETVASEKSAPRMALRLCFGCGKLEERVAFKLCGKCKALYCSRECQVKDWKLHKTLCGKTKDGGNPTGPLGMDNPWDWNLYRPATSRCSQNDKPSPEVIYGLLSMHIS